MAKYDSKSLRNIAFAGHGGTGKTSLCEALLFVSGKTERLGRVDDGSSSLDFEPEEQKRHVSLSSACTFTEWNRCKINLLDTPGDSCFSFDTKSCMRVADAAVIVIDAIGGVEFQTLKVWEFADEYKLPRVVFINRLDKERADFFQTLKSITEKLKVKVTPISLPIGKEENFRGIVNLIEGKAYSFDKTKGTAQEVDIPSDLAEEVAKYRESLVEDVAETDETLMDKYLEEGELSTEELKEGLRRAIINSTLIPVTCGSAIGLQGVFTLLDIITYYFPSPADRGSVQGTNPEGAKEERKPEEEEPFSAFVFKTIADPYAGRLNLFRVYSGQLSPDSSVFNSTRKLTERIGSIFYLEGKTQRQATQLTAGDIAAVAKLKETVTGDTLCSDRAPIIYEKVSVPPAIMSFAIEPKSRGDEEKITGALHRLLEEDPTLNFYRNDETKEMILSGMGQLHIEVTVEKMKRKFGVEVNLNIPKVPYKETIKGKARVQGKYKKQSGGRGQYGDCWIELEPLPRGGGFEFVDKIVGGVIPQQYRPAVEKGIVEAMEQGVLAGYPVVDVRVSLVDGSYHTVDSSELAFKVAGSLAFKKAALECQPTLLEPIVNIYIEVPEEYMGDVIGDLNSRRGKVMGMDSKGTTQIIKAQVPLAEILKYAPDLRSMTSGRGTFTYEHSHYEEVPAHIAEKIIAESKKREEESNK